ncbi:MAG: restriction endonuclease subunit S, partial [Bifidobacterium pseudocatenulatum]
MACEWHSAPLGELISYIGKGVAPKYINDGPDATMVLGQKCVRNQALQYEQARFHNSAEKAVNPDKEVRKGDILVNATGVGSAGRVAQVMADPSRQCITDGHVITLRAKDINPFYLGYFVKSKQNTIELMAEGSTGQTEMNRQRLQNEIIVTFPESKDLQKRIAEYGLAIDKKIAVNNQLNDYLEQLCQSLFDRFDNDENNLFVKVSDIADVNPRRTLKKGEEALCVEMADLSTTGAFPTDWRTKAYNGGVKFVNGDTILARITPCLENGKAGYINFLEQDEVAFGSTEYIVLTSKGELPSEFFYFLARNEDFISYATAHMNGSSGRQRVSGADVGNYEVRMPSEKQVSEFKEIAGKAMRVISASSIESRKLAQSRDALLPKLMSGEIDVSEVDLTQPTNNH